MPLDGEEFKKVERTLEEIKTTFRDKVDTLERQSKKLGEDAVTKDEVKKLNDALDELKKKTNDEINALNRKANRQVVVTSDAKGAELETKHNYEVSRWVGLHAAGIRLYSDQALKAMVAVDAAKGAPVRAEYKRHFPTYLRMGKDGITPDEAKALSVGNSPAGGYFVEPFRAQTMVDKMYETSDLRALCQVQSISSNAYEEPIDRDEPTTGWVGEQSSRDETNTPETGMLIIPVHEQYALVKSTQNLLDDASVDVEAWLDRKVVDELGRQENTAFVTGNGVKQPRGFTSYTTAATADASRSFGTLEHLATGASGAFKTRSGDVNPVDDFVDLLHKFKKGYRKNLRWGSNRVTMGAVRKMKDGQGNFIVDQRLAANGIVDTVLNYPWDEMPDMASYSTAGALSVVLADWSRAYIIIDRSGVRQLRDPFTSKGYVKFYTYKRVGGGVRDSDAIKFIKNT